MKSLQNILDGLGQVSLIATPFLYARGAHMPVAAALSDDHHFEHRVWSWFRTLPERISKEVHRIADAFVEALSRRHVCISPAGGVEDCHADHSHAPIILSLRADRV